MVKLPSYIEFANPYPDAAHEKEIASILGGILFPHHLVVNPTESHSLVESVNQAIRKGFPNYRNTPIWVDGNLQTEAESCEAAFKECEVDRLIVINVETLKDHDKDWLLGPSFCSNDEAPEVILISCLAPTRVFRGKFERGRSRICEQTLIPPSLSPDEAAACVQVNLGHGATLPNNIVEGVLRAVSDREKRVPINRLLASIGRSLLAIDDAEVELKGF